MAQVMQDAVELLAKLRIENDQSSKKFHSEPKSHDTEIFHDRTFISGILSSEDYRYYLPVDDEEIIRQELLNRVWSNAGIFVSNLVQDIPQGQIFDLGCGYGFWAQQVSLLCPERTVTGLDFYLPEDPGGFSNTDFEVCNFEYCFEPLGEQAALVHLRDSYLFLRSPRKLANQVSESLCTNGWFQNDEIRLENWAGDGLRLEDWRKNTIEAARRLGLAVHSAENIEQAFQEAGFQGYPTHIINLEASEAGNRDLLEVVKLTVKASVKILVAGRICTLCEVRTYIEDVLHELENQDCKILIRASVYIARKIS